ncbi:MAG: lipocalin family protein [Mucinivorans sp.]
MKSKILLILVLLCTTVFSSCEQVEKSSFNYPMESLYGQWEGTHFQLDGTWIDITQEPYTELAFSIQFKADGSCVCRGTFGDNSGTYKVKGNTVTIYVMGQEYATYNMKSLTATQMEATVTLGESVNIKARKKQ